MRAIVIGAGPAGLMAAETLAMRGIAVEVFDAMPSPGRKFLLAGKGGLNLSHAEPWEAFLSRYGTAAPRLEPFLAGFGPARLRQWAEGLGIETFVGSSGRVFPKEMKAAPLLRAWMRRLRGLGVILHVRHRWMGWTESGALRFARPGGDVEVTADATILALGGASWPNLGSDGSWVEILSGRGVAVAPLKPANCGFDLDWSPLFAERWAGARTGTVELVFGEIRQRGEITLSATGIEGGLVYALSAPLRDAIAAHGTATARLDLMPDWSLDRITATLSRPRGSKSLSTFLKKALPLPGPSLALLREVLAPEELAETKALAAAVKALPLVLKRPRPLAEAISTAGGVAWAELDEGLMLRRLPGVFVAGEMQDWEAPTGGYLLTACFATGHGAGEAAANRHQRSTAPEIT
ncbi:MAG: TIGR03862 family flavoprotein [Magnetospirillum sp.]|nr:TIGR03862 family flavoprotein [Magnetospirillum sp.]